MWAIIERFDLYESWWAWLAGFRADVAGLVPGNKLRGMVIPPAPYRLRLDVRLQRSDRPRLVEAAIGGDLRGRAALQLEAAGDGKEAGYHACGSPRRTVQPPSAAWCPGWRW
jgi:hypothetical protein